MAEPEPTTEVPAEPLNLAPVARVLVVAGVALVVIASFLEWAGRNFAPAGESQSFGGLDVPAKFLIDSEANLDGAGLPLAVLVVLVGLVGLVGALAPIPGRAVLVWASGAAAVVIVLLYAYQLNDFMDRVNELFPPGGFGVRNTVGFGAVLCGFGGVVALAGAALGVWIVRSSEVDDYDYLFFATAPESKLTTFTVTDASDAALLRASRAIADLPHHMLEHGGPGLLLVKREYFGVWRIIVAVAFFPIGLIALVSRDHQTITLTADDAGNGQSILMVNGRANRRLHARLSVAFADGSPSRTLGS